MRHLYTHTQSHAAIANSDIAIIIMAFNEVKMKLKSFPLHLIANE
jgi:hypothetical protein